MDTVLGFAPHVLDIRPQHKVWIAQLRNGWRLNMSDNLMHEMAAHGK